MYLQWAAWLSSLVCSVHLFVLIAKNAKKYTVHNYQKGILLNRILVLQKLLNGSHTSFSGSKSLSLESLLSLSGSLCQAIMKLSILLCHCAVPNSIVIE